MIQRLLLASLILFGCLPGGLSQKLKKADKVILQGLETHIRYLADDKLEGRRAGTPGEKLASDYITLEFMHAGLQPGAAGSWLQPFDINDGKQINRSGTRFEINDSELQLEKDYFPLAYSALRSVEGSPAIALQENGVPWFIDLKDALDSNQNNPHFDLEQEMQQRITESASHGATAVIFFNSSRTADNISFNPKDKSPVAPVPVLYVTAAARKKYLKDESASLEVKIKVDITEKKRTGHNVIGYLNNGAAATVILGAHYDHLGYGEDGNSMYRGPEKLIHNGADDNASGTAALIELAKLLEKNRSKNYNYLFIAFSGEELGLFGSKYYVDHPTVDLKQVDYMINMDMVGRLNDSTHVLTIGGYGTSPAWGPLLARPYPAGGFVLKYDSSGSGPSDHTSFYRKDIPVLFFFTGIHSDYHKPTDDYDKINYNGELAVVKYMYSLIQELASMNKLAFTRTRENTSGGSARFSVTLGIMPDYTFSGTGVRVDGVSDSRPAQKAGIKTGDVILQLGEYPVSSLDNYMQALGKFKKGDSAKLKYKRGTETAETQVQF